MRDSETAVPGVTGEDRQLRKSLGYWQLTAVGFSGVIGSGWLLGAMYAAQYAGPEAIVSWVIGGVVLAVGVCPVCSAANEPSGPARLPDMRRSYFLLFFACPAAEPSVLAPPVLMLVSPSSVCGLDLVTENRRG